MSVHTTQVMLLLSFILVGSCSAQSQVEVPCDLGVQPLVHHDKTVSVSGIINHSHIEAITETGTDSSILRFHNSPGGEVRAAENLVSKYETVRITGERCASACVMMLTQYEHVCVESTVQNITFHTISNKRRQSSGLCTYQVNTKRTQEYISTLPFGLQQKLTEMPFKDVTVTVTLEEFLKYYPQKLCKS